MVILTGDISADSLRDIAQHDCVPLNKPVKLESLTSVLQDLLPMPPPAPGRSQDSRPTPARPSIFVVDDDANIRTGLREVLEAEGRTVEDYASSELFLRAYRPGRDACLLIDATLPGPQRPRPAAAAAQPGRPASPPS